jgi:hypothetical protein
MPTTLIVSGYRGWRGNEIRPHSIGPRVIMSSDPARCTDVCSRSPVLFRSWQRPCDWLIHHSRMSETFILSYFILNWNTSLNDKEQYPIYFEGLKLWYKNYREYQNTLYKSDLRFWQFLNRKSKRIWNRNGEIRRGDLKLAKGESNPIQFHLVSSWF